MVKWGRLGVQGNETLSRDLDTGEYLAKLTGTTGRTVFDQMRRSDPAVASTLRAVTLPIERADWYVEPVGDDAQSKEIAEFVEDNLFGMSRTWHEILQHINLMLPFGFSILEKVWIPAGDKIRAADLGPRLPQSITGWDVDTHTGNNLGPIQLTALGKEITLPWSKILVFTHLKEGANYEGMSILRPAYKPWFVKEKLELINAIKHERHGSGVPVMKTPQGVDEKAKEYATAKSTAENIAASEQSYAVIPDGYDLSILSPGSAAGTDALPSIRYYDEMIAKVMLAMYMSLGSTETGSRALGDTFSKQFLDSLDAHADYVCDVINRHFIRELVRYNYPGAEPPVLKVSGIRPLDTGLVAQLVSSGAITATVDTENAMRRSIGLPEIDEAEWRPRPTAQPAFHTHAERQPEPEEKLVDLIGISRYFDTSQESLTEELVKIKDRQVAGIAKQIAEGKKTENISVPYKREMYDAMVRAYEDAVKQGRAQAQREMRAQRQDLALADPQPGELDDLRYEEIKLEVENSASKLKAMMLERYLALRQQGEDPAAAAKSAEAFARQELSTATWANMAALATTKGVGQGRMEAMIAQDEDVERYYYSAILDGNACPVCSETDGDPDAKNHRADDARFVTPNPLCQGGPKCRCLTIAVMKEEGR